LAAQIMVLAMGERGDGARDVSSELDNPRHQATVLGRRFNGIDNSGWPIIGMGGLAGGTGDCHATSRRTSGIGGSLSFCTAATPRGFPRLLARRMLPRMETFTRPKGLP
jgi:hypothetical protein